MDADTPGKKPVIKRNDPCPCQSGKRYRLCCMKKDQDAKQKKGVGGRSIPGMQKRVPKKVDTQTPLPPILNPIPDYGTPVITKQLFKPLQKKEFYGPKIFASELSYGLEFLQLIDKQMALLGKKNKPLRHKIQTAKDAESLLAILYHELDVVSKLTFIETAQKFRDELIPIFFKDLKTIEDEWVMEMMIRCIHFDAEQHGEEIRTCILTPPRNPYCLSLLCIELGFLKNTDDLKIIWDCYHFLKEKYPKESIYIGPLIALCEITE